VRSFSTWGFVSSLSVPPHAGVPFSSGLKWLFGPCCQAAFFFAVPLAITPFSPFLPCFFFSIILRRGTPSLFFFPEKGNPKFLFFSEFLPCPFPFSLGRPPLRALPPSPERTFPRSDGDPLFVCLCFPVFLFFCLSVLLFRLGGQNHFRWSTYCLPPSLFLAFFFFFFLFFFDHGDRFSPRPFLARRREVSPSVSNTFFFANRADFLEAAFFNPLFL